MKKFKSQEGQSSTMIIIVAVVVVLLGGAAFFLTQNKSNETTTTTTTTTTEQVQPTTAAPSEATEQESMTSSTGKTVTVEITGSPFKFLPATITANQGDTVNVIFKNTEGFHDFVVDEFDVKTKQIGAGASDEISFVVDKKGTFEYYCSVGNHRQQGMVGKLIVN